MIVDRIRDGVQKSIRPAPSTLALAHLGPPVLAVPIVGGGQPGGAPPPFYPPQGQGGPQGALVSPPPPDSATIRTEYRLLVPDERVGSLIGKEGVVR